MLVLSIPVEACIPTPDRIFLCQRTEGLNYVGVDSEWKPSFTMGIVSEENTCISVIQVATSTAVYLLDIMTLSQSLDMAEKKRFCTQFFTNPSLIKLGMILGKGLTANSRNTLLIYFVRKAMALYTT